MRVSELSGDLLDYWVARAERIEHGPDLREMRPGAVLIKVWSKEGFTFYTAYTPSTDLAQACEIIFRRRVALMPMAGSEDWIARAEKYPLDHGQDVFVDPNPLVAAMRARVWMEYGERVPKEVEA